MVAIETMSLKELFLLRDRLWADPAAVSVEIAAGLKGSAAAKFIRGEAVLLRSLTTLQRRVDALESRIAALEIQS